ncbi:MAG: hypothetical protein O7A04_12710 [Acidobacteria bacterium]|nr:hypothetical protein [Acidobacteriota bacterium]
MLLSPTIGRARATLCLLCSAFLGAGLLLGAEDRLEVERFGDSTRVTAVDVLVDLVPPGRDSRKKEAPADLALDDFIVEAGGKERTILAVQSTNEAEDERWQIVILVDLTLSSQDQVRRGLWLLAQHTEQLVGLGEVELLVTTPTPQRLVRTTDAEVLDNALSGLYLKTETLDALMRLRQNVLDEIADYVVPSAIDEAVADALRRERLLVEAVLDVWSALLVERPERPRRAVLWLGGGFDIEETAFYERLVSATGVRPELETPAREMAQTAAAYGWIVLPIALDEIPALPPDPRSNPWAVLPSMGVMYRSRAAGRLLDGNWDPDRAEAYIALAESLLTAGKPAEAEAALAKAVHYFGDSQRSSARRAFALVRRAEVRDEMGDRQGALRLLRDAKATDAVAIEEYAPKIAVLEAARVWRSTLAEASGGLEIEGEESFQAAIRSLQRRVRITYQLAGDAPGSLHPLSVRWLRNEREVRAALWGRWSVPEEVSAARLRSLWRGSGLEARRQVTARCSADADGKPRIVAAWSDAAGSDWEGSHLRLTVAYLADDAADLILLPGSHHRPTDSERVSASLPLSVTSAFVLLEDLDDEAWGVDVAACPARPD